MPAWKSSFFSNFFIKQQENIQPHFIQLYFTSLIFFWRKNLSVIYCIFSFKLIHGHMNIKIIMID